MQTQSEQEHKTHEFDRQYLEWVAREFVEAAAECEDRSDTARALSRAIQVLHWLGAHPGGLRGGAIQAALGIPRASLYRVLAALVDLRLVEQEVKSRKFRIGRAALTLGFFARTAHWLTEPAQPMLRELARQTGQTAELFVPVDSWRLIAADVWPGLEADLRVRSRPGTVGVINHRFAPGLVFLAFGDLRTTNAYELLCRSEEGRRKLGIKAGSDDWRAELSRCRRQGVACLKQSGRPGVGRMAAPVFSAAKPERPVAALGFAAASTFLAPGNAARWAPLVTRQAARLSEALPGSPSL